MAKKEAKSVKAEESSKRVARIFTHVLHRKGFVAKTGKTFRVTLCGIRFRHEKFFNKNIVVDKPSCKQCEKALKKLGA